MINPENYQEWTKTVAVYPKHMAIPYCALGLAGEAGEVADKIKKIIRDGDTEERRASIKAELGDVAWYLARLADEFGWTLSDIMNENIKKLESRRERCVLHGSGDCR